MRYALYGDALWCAPCVTDSVDDTEGFHGIFEMVSRIMKDLKAINLKFNSDQPVPHRNQFFSFNMT